MRTNGYIFIEDRGDTEIERIANILGLEGTFSRLVLLFDFTHAVFPLTVYALADTLPSEEQNDVLALEWHEFISFTERRVEYRDEIYIARYSVPETFEDCAPMVRALALTMPCRRQIVIDIRYMHWILAYVEFGVGVGFVDALEDMNIRKV